MKKKTYALLALLLAAVLLFAGCSTKDKSGDTATDPAGESQEVITADQMLSLWTDGAAAKKELTTYLEAISDESGADFPFFTDHDLPPMVGIRS